MESRWWAHNQTHSSRVYMCVMRAATLSAISLALIGLSAACGGRVASSPSPAGSVNSISCSLPVTMDTKNGGTASSQSGFITVPSGTFTPDPSGAYGSTYDWAYRRWLPVLAPQVLPDGSMYAYEVELQDRPGS